MIQTGDKPLSTYPHRRDREVERNRMKAVMNNLILHLHPAKVPAPALKFTYTWGLGGLATLLTLTLIGTGILLMFRYDASVERAYASVQYLETQVYFGSMLRSVHHWAGNLLLVVAFLHMIRVFVTGGYKQGRGINWLVGLGLLLLVVAFNFTGYLLPWDQLAYWAVTVATHLLSYIPLVGGGINNFLLAGPEVGQDALRNFYAIHVAVLPAAILAVMTYHFWRIRKDGGVSQPKRKERALKLTTIPHLVQIELVAAVTLLTTLFLWAMFVPAPLEALANPSQPPNPAKAAWYFLGLQEMLLHMHPLAALALPGIIFAGLALLPWWDAREDDIGVYFRSAIGERAALIAVALGVLLPPALVILDEFWVDFPGWLPWLPTLISNGFIPLALTLGGLTAIYVLFRRALRANHSEATLGLFLFLFVSLVTLTFIGVFFRGPNMALVWPFS
ncbi:MAG: cytochrome bc complex cytochrome b subunit [Chloroflexi bacterium]|nr:cytochrome bc complex cytochrome b subunit [Chloroflexota bacterium]